ncbi:FtsK/SpoIIIE domain-containing protein [Gryllotalpicola reticulitermitis]|uniref:FtsK/SpoIIIE domain-containing protein n=1 Tax=Gryllotalpicola reticulitermitis TaxID=1184153 RepID=A0ABV8Q7B1_9MICO
MSPLSLPPRPPIPRAPRVSWAAFAMPVVMAGVLWLMTRSPYALVFAALGPVGAAVSMFEGHRGGRRERRERLAERAAQIERIEEEIARAHEVERRALLHRAPGAAAALALADGSGLWKGDELVVSLGLGTVVSAVTVGGEAIDPAEAAVQRSAGRLAGAPVLADAGSGVAVCGQPLLARAYARGVIVQVCAALPPARLESPEVVDAQGRAGGEWDWLDRLPHATGSPGAARVRVAVFSDPRAVPPGYDAVVTVASPTAAVAELYGRRGRADVGSVARPSPPELLDGGVLPELVSRADAESFAASLATRATTLGLGAGAGSPPAEVAFCDLPPGGGTGLNASLGRTSRGIAQVDLVADGPHAIVAGMTGSGKSELLVTWVASMVSCRSSERVVVLLVDFKGGTAFQPLAVLPHVVGVITDLHHGEAARALSSLSAELRRREAELARRGVRDIADLESGLPRLVIVVDEFAAMLEAFPDFGGLFTDIAARGRALGVHLILATQRPAGVMRDALVANCPLRLSLRVQSEADSRWVVETDAAARLSAATPGRCILAANGVASELHVARTTGADLTELAARTPPAPSPRRPWLDPLPPVLTRAELPASAGPEVVGVADLPDEQRRALVRFTTEEAPLVVLGVARSGKTSALHTLAAASSAEVIFVSADRELAWDAVEAALERCEEPASGPPSLLLAIDDADALCARLGDDYAVAWCERLARVLRDGPAVGVHTVVAAQRATGPLRDVFGLAHETVLLRQATRQEHVLAGAPPELWDDGLPAGAGVWRHRRVQFLAPAPRLETVDGRPVRTAGEPVTAVRSVPSRGEIGVLVSRAPARVIARAQAAGLPREAIIELGSATAFAPTAIDALLADTRRQTGLLVVGDPDAWLAHWALFVTLKARHPVVFIGCDAADVRALTRSRTLPPPLAPGGGTGWVVLADGRTRRCRLEAA